MLRQRWSIAIVSLALGLPVGCKERQSTPSSPVPTSPLPATAPSTQPSTGTPTTQPTVMATPPAATQPAFSQLIIDGHPYTFPDAKLRVSKTGSHVVARLYTNDPKAALDDDYKGNHYDLQLRLDDIQVPQQVYMASWQYQAPSREYNDTPYGIFLEGVRYQLQPLDATARFLGTMLQVHIDLDGQFLVFDDADKSGAPPKVVYVKGSLLAPVEYKD